MFNNKASGFFKAITKTALEYVSAGLDYLIIPVGLSVLGGFFIFLLFKCVSDYNDNRGDEMKGKILWLFLIVIVAGILLLSLIHI